MADVMLQLGFYQFSIDNAAYQSLNRSTEYRWARQPRLGTNDALQFTGLGPETIDLDGVIYPHHEGGLDQVADMRLQASLGVPLPLVSGRGRFLGVWCIESVTEAEGVYARRGAAQRIDFTIKIARYDGGLTDLLRVPFR